MENKICIYAICKNEINFVHQWIENMSEADYIVVLDTGSTDGTYEVLQKDPRITVVKQKIYDSFRFDVARNDSLKLVPEDANILFCTDFDELLEPGWGDIIRNSWTEECWRGHYKYVWSHTDTGNPGVVFTYDKMHKPGYYWRFAVHEVLALVDDMEQTIAMEDGHVADYGDSIVLHHYPVNIQNRGYLPLLQLRLQENPQEPYSYYLIGREYMMMGASYFNEAMSFFKGCLRLPTIDTYEVVKFTVLGYMSAICIDTAQYPEALMYIYKQLEMDRNHREPYIWMSEIYNRMGFYPMSIYLTEEIALKTCFKHNDWSEQAVTWNEKPHDILATAYYNLGNKEMAMYHSLKALKLAPNDKRLQDNYLTLVEELSKGDTKEIEQ